MRLANLFSVSKIRLFGVLFCSVLAPSAFCSTYVYVGNATSNDISVLKLDSASGNLAVIQTIALPASKINGPSTPMTTSKSGVLYAMSRGSEKSLSRFKINPNNGQLKLLDSHPINENIAFLALDKSEQYLLAASYSEGSVSVSRMTETGQFALPHQVLTGFKNAHAVAFTADNHQLILSSLGSDKLFQFNFDDSLGLLSPEQANFTPLPPDSGPRHLRIHPNGKFLYVIGELDAKVHVFTIPADGRQLSPLQTIDMLTPESGKRYAAAEILLNNKGDRLFTSERTTNEICSFKLTPDNGHLSLIHCTATETTPRGMALDSSTQHLFVAGQTSGYVSRYKIDPVGKLNYLERVKVGTGPNWIEVVVLPKP